MMVGGESEKKLCDSAAAMKKKSRILIIGVTGNIGHHLALSSLRSSYPTYALVRPSALSDPTKSLKLDALSNAGLTILKGSLEDVESLIEALKRVDVVISAVGARQCLEQKSLIRAIKAIGTIKKFIPSEFGSDPDKVQIKEMDNGLYGRKAEIRRLLEEEGIPYTIISCNFFMSCLLPSLVQPGLTAPPRDEVSIFGDGNVAGVFIKDKDVAEFTIRAVDDPRTLNRVLYLRPPGNVVSLNELVGIWETKIGNTLKKNFVSEDELLRRIRENKYPANMPFILIYSTFIKGDHTYFDIDTSGGLDGTKLYPDMEYTTISQYLDTLV